MCKTNNEEKKFISLVSETTFKYLWKNVNTRDWLNDIIKARTGIDLHNFDFIDSKQNSGNDVINDLIFSNEKEIVIIEMNNCKSKTTEDNGRYYLYHKVNNSFDKGNEKYEEAKKVTLIMMNNYKNSYDEDRIFSNSWLDNHLLGVNEANEMYQFYLPIYKKMCYDRCDEINKRLCLFGATSFKEMHDKVKNDSNLYIVEELERLSVNDAFIDEYNQEAVNKKMMMSLLDEGLEQGKKEEKIKIAKKMLEENIDIEIISKIIGLTKKELDELI